MKVKAEEIIDRFRATYYDIRAEVFLYEMMSKYNFELEDITVLNQGTFNRGYRRDILNLRKTEKEILNVFLSRNGIYDKLPYGLFHKEIKQNTTKSFNQIRKQGKEEEKSARKLFAPIENEFFVQKLLIQKNENTLKRNLANSEKSFLFDLWGIKDLIDKKFIFSFSKLLPLSYKISKSKELIAKSLEEILKNEVTIEEQWKPFNGIEKKETKEEDFALGINSTLETGENSYLFPKYLVTVKLNNPEEYKEYLGKGKCYKLISVFWEYFVPLEIDLELNVITKSENHFILNNKANAVLGLATTI